VLIDVLRLRLNLLPLPRLRVLGEGEAGFDVGVEGVGRGRERVLVRRRLFLDGPLLVQWPKRSACGALRAAHAGQLSEEIEFSRLGSELFPANLAEEHVSLHAVRSLISQTHGARLRGRLPAPQSSWMRGTAT